MIPRSRSAFNLSKTHAYLKEPLPNSAASWNNCQYVLWWLMPWRHRLPIRNFARGKKPHQEMTGVLGKVPSRCGESVPSRIFRLYACRYHRTCRSNVLERVSARREIEKIRSGEGCTCGGGFAGVDMSDDDDVDVSLFFTGTESMISLE